MPTENYKLLTKKILKFFPKKVKPLTAAPDQPPDDPFAVNNFNSEKIKKLLPQKNVKILMVFIIFLLFLLMVKQILILIKNRQITNNLPPSTSPTPITRKISSPSAYATDSAVLKIEEDLSQLEKQMLETDFEQSSLFPPVLDFEIKF